METIVKILSELHPDVDLSSVDDLIEEGILDSLDMVRLVTEIRLAFDVMIPAEELVPENFKNAGTIFALVERLDEA